MTPSTITAKDAEYALRLAENFARDYSPALDGKAYIAAQIGFSVAAALTSIAASLEALRPIPEPDRDDGHTMGHEA